MKADRFVRRTFMAGKPRGREFSLEWGDQSRVRELRVWYTDSSEPGSSAIAALQVIWQAEDRTLLGSPIMGPVAIGADGQAAPHHEATQLDAGDVVNGLYGHHRGGTDRINSIGVITQDGPRPLLGSPVGAEYRWALEDMPDDQMPGALVTGIFGRYDRSGLCGIGLRCAVDGVGPLVLSWGPGGRVVPAADAGRLPRIDEDRIPKAPAEHPDNDRIDPAGEPTPESMRPNPNHRRIDVRRVDQWDDILRIHSRVNTPEEFRYLGRDVDQDARQWTDVYQNAQNNQVIVHLDPDNPRIELAGGTILTAPVVPRPAPSDGPTWDNVFSLDHRVDYLAWALRGLDISRLAPFNLLKATGVLQQEVFKAPLPGSRDFHIANNAKATVVPNGWTFVGDVSGSTKARTASAFSEEESRLTWATSLGISAETDAVGAKVAYKNNSKAHDELSAASSGKVVSTIVESMELSHSLVVDLATVELSPGFRRAVDELKADPTFERIEEFLDRFGTHFAHAVTFGSKNWEQRHETEESVADSMTHGTSQDQSLEAGYHNEVGGVSGSVAWGSEKQSSASTKRGTGSDVSSKGSVGTPSEPVPILLEVEELTELLTPLFFDDPYVYVDLRQKVTDFLYDPEFLQDLEDYDSLPSSLSFEFAPDPVVESFEDKIIKFGSSKPVWVHVGMRFPLVDEANEVVAPVGALGGLGSAIDGATLLKATNADEVSGWIEGLMPASPWPPTIEGKTIRPRGGTRVWWIRGGRTHPVENPDQDFDYLPIAPGTWSEVTLEDYPDSGEPVTTEGKMVLARSGPREVWWIRGGKRHVVPSGIVVDVLGGWELVATVDEEFLERFEVDKKPTSVEGKMVRKAPDPEANPSDYPLVWVIHERQRHLITNELGVRKRGGWQQVAVVRQDILDWFRDSGAPAL